jgi:hypothetical protein
MISGMEAELVKQFLSPTTSELVAACPASRQRWPSTVPNQIPSLEASLRTPLRLVPSPPGLQPRAAVRRRRRRHSDCRGRGGRRRDSAKFSPGHPPTTEDCRVLREPEPGPWKQVVLLMFVLVAPRTWAPFGHGHESWCPALGRQCHGAADARRQGHLQRRRQAGGASSAAVTQHHNVFPNSGADSDDVHQMLR